MSNIPSSTDSESRCDIKFDDESFPPMTALPKKYSSWGGKSFKDALVCTEIQFDYDVLEKRLDENESAYYSRLLELFKKTTTTCLYSVYNVQGIYKTYRVAARHETIARLLCQTEENRHTKNIEKTAYAEFKHNILNNMYDDEELMCEVLMRVGGDVSMRDEAIRIFYTEQNPVRNKGYVWMDPKKTTCVKSVDTCMSKEKILY